MFTILLRTLVLLASALVPRMAAAHDVVASESGLLNGVLHPFLAWPLVPQLVVIGLFLHRSGIARDPRLAVLALAVAAGGLIYPIAPAPQAIAWLAPLVGVVAALPTVLARRLPAAPTMALAAALGLAFGYANGDGLLTQTQPGLFLLGLTLGTTAAVFYLGAGLARIDRPWLPRATGGFAALVLVFDLALIGVSAGRM